MSLFFEKTIFRLIKTNRRFQFDIFNIREMFFLIKMYTSYKYLETHSDHKKKPTHLTNNTISFSEDSLLVKCKCATSSRPTTQIHFSFLHTLATNPKRGPRGGYLRSRQESSPRKDPPSTTKETFEDGWSIVNLVTFKLLYAS